MSWVLALAGWLVAVAALARLRRMLHLVADAEHELRGAATVIGLAADRTPRTRYADLVRLQLDRMDAGLADLRAARAGRRSSDAELRAGRLAQVVGNLLANATEHGAGPVQVTSTRLPSGVRVEIRNRNRGRDLRYAAAGHGRGLAIAARAAREIGGSLWVDSREEETVATVQLPTDELRRAA